MIYNKTMRKSFISEITQSMHFEISHEKIHLAATKMYKFYGKMIMKFGNNLIKNEYQAIMPRNKNEIS